MSNENDSPDGKANEATKGNTPTVQSFAKVTNDAQKEVPKAAIVPGNRKVILDYYIAENIENEGAAHAYKIYTRLNARKKTFRKVNFQHCIFDACYFNTCVFDTCDFTGCRFIGCNFHRTTFRGCTFDYALFERTQVDDDILRQEAPREENLKMRFARSLRMNFQQVGDAKAVNKAISLELEATSIYLKKSWASEETYYREKYPGWKRFPQFIKWAEFRILDFIWGNGESAWKLLRTILLIHVLIAAYDTIKFGNALNLADYWTSFVISPGIFFGIGNATIHPYPILFASAITALRLMGFALFTAILVKRFGRR